MDVKVYGCGDGQHGEFVRTPNCPSREAGGIEYGIKRARQRGLTGPLVVVECIEVEEFVCIEQPNP